MYTVCMASDINELHGELHRVGNAQCVSCGGNDWMTPSDRPVLLPTVEPDGTWVPGRGIEAIESICGKCGFIRLHSAQILRRGLKGNNGR